MSTYLGTGIVHLDKCDSASIVLAFEEVLLCNKLNVKNLVAIGTDNALIKLWLDLAMVTTEKFMKSLH